MLKRNLFLTLIIIFFSSCAHNLDKNLSKTSTQEEEGDLILIATSDFHSSFERAESLYNIVNALKNKYGEKAVHLDGGDLFQGSLEGNLSKGKSVVEFFNALNLDAAAIGNHELDYGTVHPKRTYVLPNEDGLGNLKQKVKLAKFAWLSSNWILDSNNNCNPKTDKLCNGLGKKTVFEPRVLLHAGSTKKYLVCVIGATTPTTPKITDKNFIKGTEFLPLKETLEAEVKFLNENYKCDFKIVTMHAGLMCDKNENCKINGVFSEALHLLEALPFGYFDAIIAGHTHQKAREIINGVPVLEPGCFAKQVGVLHLFKSKTKTPRFEDWHYTKENDFNPIVSKLLKPYREKASKIKNEFIGYAKYTFEQNYSKETALGNLATDAILKKAKQYDKNVNLAFVNAGGIRQPLTKGKITFGDIYKAFPFDNSLSIVKLKGSELRTFLEIAYSGAQGVPPISGFKIKVRNYNSDLKNTSKRDLNHDGKFESWEQNSILEIIDDSNKPLDDNKTYTLATIDYLTNGAENYDFIFNKLKSNKIKNHIGIFVRDILKDYIKSKKEIDPKEYYNEKQLRIEIVN
jgi:2',3'-cyclic-nucleotide 2'-phosphodiesterase (5'-nucleotidase family)